MRLFIRNLGFVQLRIDEIVKIDGPSKQVGRIDRGGLEVFAQVFSALRTR